MPSVHTVRPGDCLLTLATEQGFTVERLWNLPENAPLREDRLQADAAEILAEGGAVRLPDRIPGESAKPSDQRHRFRRPGMRARLHVRFLDRGEPRADLPYTLEWEGEREEGTTDSLGELEIDLPVHLRAVKLRLGDLLTSSEDYVIKLGGIDPHQTLRGIQHRLGNLGYDCGQPDGVLGARTQRALSDFQSRHDLECTGEADETTIARLREVHGS